jgi:hypothetical protein
VWSHKKFGKKTFEGFYAFDRGERVFELNCGARRITFESHEAAKALGWVGK